MGPIYAIFLSGFGFRLLEPGDPFASVGFGGRGQTLTRLGEPDCYDHGRETVVRTGTSSLARPCDPLSRSDGADARGWWAAPRPNHALTCLVTENCGHPSVLVGQDFQSDGLVVSGWKT